MTPDKAAYGASLRQARALRVRMIRRRVIAGALALFVATWLFITLVLVTGHDPALASQAAASTSSTPAASTATSTSSTPTTTTVTSTPSTSSAGASSAGSSGASAVTSKQS